MAPNMKSWLSFGVFAALTTLASADVQITKLNGNSISGATITAGATGVAVTVEWTDSGDTPKIADLSTYQLFLCAGGNDPASILQLLEISPTNGAPTFSVTGNKATGTVGSGLGDSKTKNAYFFKMISVAKAGGTVTNYSPRFSMSGMTGSFDSQTQVFKDGLASIKGSTDGPDRVDATADNAPPGGGQPQDGDFDMQYSMQTGPTRYAPMQVVPPTKITKKNTTPLFPTSHVDIAKSFLPIPKAQTTITKSQTFSVSSMENTVSAAPMPSDDMAKFLARWKD